MAHEAAEETKEVLGYLLDGYPTDRCAGRYLGGCGGVFEGESFVRWVSWSGGSSEQRSGDEGSEK